MKKLIAVLLAAVLVVSLAACGGSKAPSYEGSMSDLVDAIYEIYPVETMLSENIPHDLADAELLKYYGAVSDGSKISEGVYSMAMITIDPYLMSAVRVNDAKDAADVANDILANADPGMWICVRAEAVRVGYCGDVVVMVMGSTEIADGIMNAFSQVVGADLTILSK